VDHKNFKIEKLFELAKPYLKKNDLGYSHTQRVFDIAQKNFDIPNELEDLIFASIILHDIGGSSVKEQYDKGPEIATFLLHQLGYSDEFIKMVCENIQTHHNHLKKPSQTFKILYDSDRLVMFCPEEFQNYDSRPNFNWVEVIDSMYNDHSKNLAKELLQQRKG